MAKIRDIADVAEYPNVFLSSYPNFLRITPKPAEFTYYEASILVSGGQSILISNEQGEEFELIPTPDTAEADGLTFFASSDAEATANNIVEALRSIDYLRANHVIFCTPSSALVRIKSKGTNPNYANLTVDSDYTFTIISTATEADSVRGSATNCAVLCDVFEGASEFLGQPANDSLIGTYSHTLAKNYAGGAVEFDLSTLRPLTFEYAKGVQGWQNYNSLLKFKLFAKFNRDNINAIPFYVSPPLYVLVSPVELSNIQLNSKISGQFAKLLSSKPATWQTLNGGVEYFSILYADEFHGLDSFAGDIEVCVSVQDSAGEQFARVYSNSKDLLTFAELNTVGFNTASVLTTYPQAGRLDIYLTRNRVKWSESRIIKVLAVGNPSETVEFINEFGVLETFHFAEFKQVDYKTEQTEFQKIATRSDPTTQRRTEVKAPLSVGIASAPASDETAIWLQNLAKSPAVWYGGKLLTSVEVGANVTDENRDLQTVNIKMTWEQ